MWLGVSPKGFDTAQDATAGKAPSTMCLTLSQGGVAHEVSNANGGSAAAYVRISVASEGSGRGYGRDLALTDVSP